MLLFTSRLQLSARLLLCREEVSNRMSRPLKLVRRSPPVLSRGALLVRSTPQALSLVLQIKLAVPLVLNRIRMWVVLVVEVLGSPFLARRGSRGGMDRAGDVLSLSLFVVSEVVLARWDLDRVEETPRSCSILVSVPLSACYSGWSA